MSKAGSAAEAGPMSQPPLNVLSAAVGTGLAARPERKEYMGRGATQRAASFAATSLHVRGDRALTQ